jgi:hypothetical protein
MSARERKKQQHHWPHPNAQVRRQTVTIGGERRKRIREREIKSHCQNIQIIN